MDDHTLLNLRADIDFTYDERGRILATNEPLPAARVQAPRLLLARSSGGQIVRIGFAISDDQALRLTTIADSLRNRHALERPFDEIDGIRNELTLDEPIVEEGGGPAYRFPVVALRTPHAQVVQLTNDNRHLLRETYPWLFEELSNWGPCFAVVADRTAVSICFSARRGVAAAEAGVETHPDVRGRGYAAAVTTAWANAIQQTGRIPIYSTSWNNSASRGVAMSLKLTMFGSDIWWR